MTTVRQPYSIPQSGWMLGIEQVLGPPDRMVGRQRAQPLLVLRKELFHQSLEAGVELAAAAARVGEDEASLLDKIAEVLPGGLR